ncbi:TIGR04197 family type VII secretion effector [Streptococcus pacificus]|uniref:TIGR04197 family type VII secretion effector n=1 Tax=Streptococcus pacificus TaxID=2740577 RepID=A0ABS0ZJE6_9STRE|nr:TIGR04197 family type VII secretion effector [Streptococcus pacificus]MBJ8326123.1 TIGR04197 family type VII secretion effector [Streptococcus pacificus]
MTQIISNQERVEEHQHTIGNALSQLSTTSSPVKDTLSTVKGNEKAHVVIDKAQNLAKEVQSAIIGATDQLQFIANQFKENDDKNARRFGEN